MSTTPIINDSDPVSDGKPVPTTEPTSIQPDTPVDGQSAATLIRTVVDDWERHHRMEHGAVKDDAHMPSAVAADGQTPGSVSSSTKDVDPPCAAPNGPVCQAPEIDGTKDEPVTPIQPSTEAAPDVEDDVNAKANHQTLTEDIDCAQKGTAVSKPVCGWRAWTRVPPPKSGSSSWTKAIVPTLVFLLTVSCILCQTQWMARDVVGGGATGRSIPRPALRRGLKFRDCSVATSRRRASGARGRAAHLPRPPAPPACAHVYPIARRRPAA